MATIDLITRKEAAEMLGIDLRTFDRMRPRFGFAEVHLTGTRNVHFRRKEIERYLLERVGGSSVECRH